MKTKLLFCSIQKWRNHILSFLIIFFMTVYSFSQENGIEFEFNCSGSTITVKFGKPNTSGTYYIYPEGTAFNNNDVPIQMNWFVVFEPSQNRWELKGPTTQDGSGTPVPFFANNITASFPSDNANDWVDLNTGGQPFSCTLTSVIYTQSSDDPDNDGDGFPASLDCNDNDATINTEITYYVDVDGDGFGSTPEDICSSTVPAGYAIVGGDCDDTIESGALINPDATEICDGIDNNCDGNLDEGFTSTTYYADTDNDGFGDPNITESSCDGAPIGFVEDNTDCDDTNPAINPDATELPYDGEDNDCNPATLDDDLDEDGVINANDCNDNDPTISDLITYFVDTDGDGFGSTPEDICSSTEPAGYSIIGGDCDDTNALINPDAIEIPDDGIDQDCDGVDDVTTTINFVIIAEEEVHLHGNNLVTGNVGATNENGKVKLHEYSTVTGSVEASEIEINNGSSAGSTTLAPAVVDLPPFVFNSVSDDSDFDIKVEEGQTITLNDQIYGKIEVKEGGTLIFNNSNVFIEELKTYKNTTVSFTGCTNLFINKEVKFEDNTEFNSSGESVTMYVDDDVIIEEGSNVTAFIYANKYVEAKSKDENPINMTGFFSGKKVKGEKTVFWQGQLGYVPCEIIELEISEDDFCECKDGMVSLTIDYNGNGVLSTNSGTITDNGDGTFTITNDGEKLEKDLEISDEGGDSSNFATIHTSCSQEILNVTYDETFTVVSYTDNIGNTCEVNYSSKVAIEDLAQDGPVAEFKVTVWPNPSFSLFNVKLQTPNAEDETILQAFDINGRLIHSTIINGNEDYEFGGNLQSGIYFVKISQAKTTEVVKVIKR